MVPVLEQNKRNDRIFFYSALLKIRRLMFAERFLPPPNDSYRR